jgi:predicted dehydrogenase
MSLQVALIGCGRIGQRHAEHINNIGQLKAVCDIDMEKATGLGKKYGANCYSSAEELLDKEKNLDVVSVCTPNGLHAAHSILALKAGCHVLCEKPMAITSVDCRKMIEASEKAGRHLLVVKQNRYNPPVEAVKKMLDENKLGNIFSFQLSCFWHRDAAYYKDDWRGTKELDGGTLFTQFSHFIDLLCWFFGNTKDVKAFSGNYLHKEVIDFEDTGVVILQFENNIIGTINYTVNSFKKNMEGSLTIFGEKGTVKIGGEYLNQLAYMETMEEMPLLLPAGSNANSYGTYAGSMSNHDKVYINLVEVLQGKTTMTAGSADGLRTVEMIEEIYTAAKNIS